MFLKVRRIKDAKEIFIIQQLCIPFKKDTIHIIHGCCIIPDYLIRWNSYTIVTAGQYKK